MEDADRACLFRVEGPALFTKPGGRRGKHSLFWMFLAIKKIKGSRIFFLMVR